MKVLGSHGSYLLTIDPNFQRDIQRDGSHQAAINSHLRDMNHHWLVNDGILENSQRIHGTNGIFTYIFFIKNQPFM